MRHDIEYQQGHGACQLDYMREQDSPRRQSFGQESGDLEDRAKGGQARQGHVGSFPATAVSVLRLRRSRTVRGLPLTRAPMLGSRRPNHVRHSASSSRPPATRTGQPW